jgi:hypothetical protein
MHSEGYARYGDTGAGRDTKPPVFDLKEVEPWMVRTAGTVRIAPELNR